MDEEVISKSKDNIQMSDMAFWYGVPAGAKMEGKYVRALLSHSHVLSSRVFAMLDFTLFNPV